MLFTIHLSKLSVRSFIWAAMAFSVSANAAPTIQWNPEKIEIRQVQGAQAHYSAEVIFNTEGKNVTARLVPALEQWITVSPVSYGDIQQGQTVAVDLLVDIPSNQEVGSHSGVLQLRSEKNQKNLAKPLPISLTIVPQSEDGLPPDPGEAGKATLVGIDSDRDGVRDDVQRYIVHTYPNQPNIQKALFQLTRSYAGMYNPDLTKEEAYKIALKNDDAISCSMYFDWEESIRRFELLRAEILNTIERSKKYLEYDAMLSGMTFSAPDVESEEYYKFCDFDVQQ